MNDDWKKELWDTVRNSFMGLDGGYTTTILCVGVVTAAVFLFAPSYLTYRREDRKDARDHERLMKDMEHRHQLARERQEAKLKQLRASPPRGGARRGGTKP